MLWNCLANDHQDQAVTIATMSLPLLFTLPPSNRHEFLLLDTSSKITLKSLNAQITSTISSSPNCAECTSNNTLHARLYSVPD